MRYLTALLSAVLLLFVDCLPAHSETAEDAAIASLARLGGEFDFDKDNERVVAVILKGDKVNDAALVHINALSDLKALSLFTTKVTGSGLVHLKELKELKTLSFSGSAIRDPGLAHLKELTQLQKLDLTQAVITDSGMANLKTLTNLTYLSLSNTVVTNAGLVHLKGMTQLESLDLARCKISDAGLVHLKDLTTLTSLRLYDTTVRDIGLEQLKGMNKVTWLMLKRTYATEEGVRKLKLVLPDCTIYYSTLPPVANTPVLELKEFTGPNGKDVFLEEIKADRGSYRRDEDAKIITLRLKGQKVNNSHLQGAMLLPHVNELHLEYTWELTSDGLAALKELKSLHSLSFVSVRQMNDETVSHLTDLPNLRTLKLHGVEIGDRGMDHIAEMKKLRRLYILVNLFVTDAGLAKLQGFDQLIWLRLYGCKTLTDKGFANFPAMPELETLDLRETNISDSGLQHLRTFSTLETLQLEGTKVTQAGVDALRKALPNCKVTFTGDNAK
jgi:Leucine-rich repeat (LRR) protein